MNVWPSVVYKSLEEITPGAPIRDPYLDSALVITIHDQDLRMLLAFEKQVFRFHTCAQTHSYLASEGRLDIRIDWDGAAGEAAPSSTSGHRLFILNDAPCIVARAPEGVNWRLVNLATGMTQPSPSGAIGFFSCWSMGFTDSNGNFHAVWELRAEDD